MPDITPNHPHQAGQRPEDHADQAGKAHPEGGGSARLVRELRMSRLDRVGDTIVSALARVGIGPFHLLTTRGRKTGRLYTNPVTLVEQDGRRWLVAPYGAVSWVHNARAAGRVTLRRAGDTRDYAIREVRPDEAGPILKRYIGIASATRPYFQAGKDSPVDDFVAEAHRHPCSSSHRSTRTPVPRSRPGRRPPRRAVRCALRSARRSPARAARERPAGHQRSCAPGRGAERPVQS
jgi:deazaflavin-dependent oxidoreductase (nitroreductase family)